LVSLVHVSSWGVEAIFFRDERFLTKTFTGEFYPRRTVLIWISAREFLSGTNGFLSIFFSFGFFGLFLWLLEDLKQEHVIDLVDDE